MPITAEDITQLIDALDANPELKRALQDKLIDAEAVLRAIRRSPEIREAAREELLGAEILQIPELVRAILETQRRQTEQIERLIEGQQRHEAILREHTAILREHTALLQEHSVRLQELREGQQRHEAILQEHSQQLRELREGQQRHEATLQEHTAILQDHSQQLRELREGQEELREGQKELREEVRTLRRRFDGFEGRFNGILYEQEIVKRAPNIFQGGLGGSTSSPLVNRRLREWLRPIRRQQILSDEDPRLADLIWWKGDAVMVVEISLTVESDDVERAQKRARTLQQVGVQATPLVIGEGWASPELSTQAQSSGVAWCIAGEFSDAALEFRRIPDE